MQLTTFTLAALSVASALASDVAVHVVKVSGTTNSLTYTPNNVTAAVGDMIQFQFGVGNHTVTQSTFDQPCAPISLETNVTGIFSGFMPVTAGATSVPTYTILVNATTPMWFYCSQAKHCQSGMVMVVNENTAKNATRSLANFTALAAKAAKNLAPGETATNGTTSSTGAGASASASAGSGYGSGYGGSAPSSSTTSAGAAKSTSGASSYNVPSMGGLLAVGVAALLL